MAEFEGTSEEARPEEGRPYVPRAPRSNVTFETIKAEEIPFGKNNFIEVARKKAKSDEGENEFISISRGYILPDGTKKWKTSLSIPLDQNVIDFVSEKLKQI